jgi:hypothetical protein
VALSKALARLEDARRRQVDRQGGAVRLEWVTAGAVVDAFRLAPGEMVAVDRYYRDPVIRQGAWVRTEERVTRDVADLGLVYVDGVCIGRVVSMDLDGGAWEPL